MTPDARSRIPAETSRRTLVRTAAWTLPVASVAAAAPAYAVLSVHSSLTITTSTYYWLLWPARELGSDADLWGVVPLITVRNDGSSPPSDLQVTLSFPPSFVGPVAQEPTFINSPGGGWTPAWVQPPDGKGGSGQVAFYGPANLATGQSSTLGSPLTSGNPFSLGWTQKSTDPVTVTATATGYAPAVGGLSQVDPPPQ